MPDDRILHRYTVTTYTGDHPDAATDAGIFFTLIGKNGQTAEIQHDTVNDDHEVGKADSFTFDHADLGEITAIHMRSDGNQPPDGRSHGPGWQLIKVEVEDHTPPKKRWGCPFNSWLRKDQPYALDAMLGASPIAADPSSPTPDPTEKAEMAS